MCWGRWLWVGKTNFIQGWFFTDKFINIILGIRRIGMSSFLQFCKDESAYCPDRSPSRSNSKFNQKEERLGSISNTKSQYLRNKQEVQSHQRSVNKEDPSGYQGYNRYERVQPQERCSFNQPRLKIQHQLYSKQEVVSPTSNMKLNDFSFEEGISRKTSHLMLDNSTRDNAKKRGLQIKMSNIESINDKIYNLLSLVKKDRKKEAEDNKEAFPSQLNRNYLEGSHNKSVDNLAKRPKESKPNVQIADKKQVEHYSFKHETKDKSNQRTTLLTIDCNGERNIQNTAKAEPSQRFQRDANEYNEVQQENLYISPVKNRIKERNQGSLRTYFPKDEPKVSEPIEEKKAYNCSKPDSKKEEKVIKSIEEMINERREARNKVKLIEPNNTANNGPNTYTQESTQLPYKRQTLQCIYQKDNESHSSATKQSSNTHSRKSSVYLEAEEPPSRPETPKPQKDGYAGKIYKKTTLSRPSARPSFSELSPSNF